MHPDRATLYYTAAAPFDAARSVPVFPAGHRSSRLHGHGFVARLRTRLAHDWAPFSGAETDALEAHLQACIAPLDYRLLNEFIEVPSDQNLARWMRRRLALPDIDRIGIQSARDQGVDLDAADRAHVWHRFRFEAAHRLPNVQADHPCGRMHGHGFEVIVHAGIPLGGADLSIDFDRIATFWQPLHAQLHHHCLNDIGGLENPTSELIAAWIWQRLRPRLPEMSWITVYETATAGCHFDGSEYRIWKERRFEAATRLAGAPDTDPRSRLHGHSYTARMHLTAPLDELLGWTLDYGDVKACFEPCYQLLDHHDLQQLPGVDAADIAAVARWACARLAPVLPQLDRFDLLQKPGCGCVLSWGEEGPALPV
jgi:6-pyruvoyltetrahydropterin/6-carboxytetrahydropterin synthase